MTKSDWTLISNDSGDLFDYVDALDMDTEEWIGLEEDEMADVDVNVEEEEDFDPNEVADDLDDDRGELEDEFDIDWDDEDDDEYSDDDDANPYDEPAEDA